ncbi:two-component system response regulator FixJ [Rhodoblastus acidophilus]|uniref:response regulator transcription factor n=1 Tax=Rhodoblastus acidophilus TaxID=1074 RepID=UPI002225234A|nr:response regulator [Rhodoblastus acidophilus]MCW2286583.1 two-component system response regulator FixJ [Rhodoblastus acidophilus]MCW2335447.1 two-component system response regulator FixJ [Rhodoblastus acidophilus]
MNGAASVYIVDDDAAIRESLTLLLETEGLNARAFSSALEFLAAPLGEGPGCVVTDLRMAGMSGMELLAQIRQSPSPLPVVVITAYGDVRLAVEAMKLGASDFLEKPYSETAFVAAVRGALDAAADAEARASDRREIEQRFKALTPPERRVLAGLLEGKLNKTAAFEMGVSLRTVEALRASVMAKLGADCLSDLVRSTMRAGLDRFISAGSDETGPSPRP